MRKALKNILAIFLILSMPVIFAWAIIDGLNRQEKQVADNCKGLTGYEYGACSMKYYR